MEIFFWSDYACPYCYIGETNSKAALRELGITAKTAETISRTPYTLRTL